MPETSYFLCAVCGTPTSDAGACNNCGLDGGFITVKDAYVTEFPADTMACTSCGSTVNPLVFRGWSRLAGFFVWSWETRMAGYVCRSCARDETTKALLFSAILGWWSFPSFFFFGWRALYFNWRSVWTAPGRPYEWGAVSGPEVAADIREWYADATSDLDDAHVDEHTPLGRLTQEQRLVVAGAEDLYGLLGVDSGADTDTIGTRYRAMCKEHHPDLRQSDDDSTDMMIRLNRAWEVLRSPDMRAAYDWLQGQRGEATT